MRDLGCSFFKIPSGEVTNLPLLEAIAKSELTVILSTGMSTLKEIDETYKFLKERNASFAFMHCVSEYPCPHDRLGLEAIEEFKNLFPSCKIGVSDHFNGTLSGPVAYMLGARVFEKHVTLNRAWKGTDHSFSLEPNGFKNIVRDIKRVPEMMQRKNDGSLGNEAVFIKLGKSIVASKDLKAGKEIHIDDLSGKIFSQQHVPVRESRDIIGKTLKVSKKEGEIILHEDITK